MPSHRIINPMLTISAATGLTACDYFSVESQLYRQVNGLYGADTNCAYVSLIDEPAIGKDRPILTVADHYIIDDRYCSLEEVVKDGDGFILKPQHCTGNWQRIYGSESTFDHIDLFELRVEAINKDTVIFQETGKEPVTVYRCGSKIH